MRSLSSAALLGAALIAVAPAAAQVAPPQNGVYDPGGPVYYNSPAPPQNGVWDPAGPTYYNSPPATVSPNPPSYNAPGYVYDPAGPTYYNTPSATSPRVAMPQQAGAPYAAPQGSFNAQQSGPSVWQNGRWVVLPPRGMRAPQSGNPQRWGGMNGGRWYAGTQAPGGWSAYRRPRRGGSLSGYWMSDAFRIPDYLSFGLAAPPYGYSWTRYYDDAVLVDMQGRVWDSVSGIAWSGASASASSGRGYASASSSASASSGMQQVDPNAYYGQPAYGDPIPYPSSYPQGGYAPPAVGAPPAVYFQGNCPQTCPGASYGSYYSGGGGYYGGGSTTTTVTIQPAPIVTTTTIEEEVTEEVTTTSYVSTPRRVVRRAAPVRRYHPKPRRRVCACSCCR